jgi:hypothetical protein
MLGANALRTALCAVFLLVNAALAEPPKVVSVTPNHGDTGVDPGTSEIRIEFDQDMQPGGFSICGGGPNFPTPLSRPTWKNARTLVVPVKLKPGHTYEFSINCPAARNFRSVKGESAEITPVRFTTAAAGDKPRKPVALSPEANAAAVDALRKAIDERYSYRDRVVRDWGALFKKHEEALIGASTPSAFAREAARMLGAARDIHLSLAVGEARFPTHRAQYQPNFDLELLSKTVPGWQKRSDIVWSGRFDDGVGYLLIASWPGEREALAAAHAALDEMIDAPALVIDVRPNGGGDELAARRVAGRFVGTETVYSRNRTRDPQDSDGWTEVFNRVVKPSDAPANSKPCKARTAVLIGPGCMSSNESFILMMKHGAGSLLVGDTTGGSSGNPRGIELGNGVTVILPSWEDLLPDGTVLEGRGITPDVEVSFRPARGVASDAVLDAALQRLRKP